MEKLKLEIKHLIIDALELEDTTPNDIDNETQLFGEGGLGLDSIDALELGVALRKKYQLQLEENISGNRDHFQSINSLAIFVQQHRKNT
jgi:acyl carrier protein